MTVGIQVDIPLASPREQREHARQALAEATRIDEVRNRALTDLAKPRELEAERAAVGERLDFHKSKADWMQERIREGYEGDVEKRWETAQKQNAEAAAVKRLDGLSAAQRRQVAHPAGDRWQPLLDDLSGKLKQLPTTGDDLQQLDRWLCREVLPVDPQARHGLDAALDGCRAHRLEPPARDHLDRVIRSAVYRYETRQQATIHGRLSAANERLRGPPRPGIAP